MLNLEFVKIPQPSNSLVLFFPPPQISKYDYPQTNGMFLKYIIMVKEQTL